ncbi:MAG: hypothetical protein ABIO16_16265 [Nocardioides sp.]
MWFLLFLLGWVSTPQPVEHTQWDVIDQAQVDVDGDGVPEKVIVRETLRGHARPEVAVHFADGRIEVSSVEGKFRVDWIEPYDVDDRPGQELVVHDILDYSVSARTYRDGAWVLVPTERPLQLRTSIATGGHGFAVLTNGPRIVSYRSVKPFDVGYDYAFPPSAVYAVDVYRWRYADGVLAPHPLGRRCIRQEDAARFVPCP